MQTKRLHISGLTPAISEKDIYTRFSVFGTVKTVSGIGEFNAVGQPRNFAFISLEATPEKISKCLNVLSGSTWKGTKLRIGDARPDYEQRLQMERMEITPPSKRRRLAHGTESKDMSLVTLENVDKHPGWKKTSLSHLIRPMRMRPLHSIPPPTLSQSVSSGKKKKRKIMPPTRARRQKIDPSLYNRVHMTERMLLAEQVVVPPTLVLTSTPAALPPVKSPVQSKKEKVIRQESSNLVEQDEDNPYLVERQRDLGLLALLFDGKDKWEGKEDDLEDIDMGSTTLDNREDVESASENEIVEPPQVDEEPNDAVLQDHRPSTSPLPTSQHAHQTRLKDLFTSKAAEPQSILLGLDLDLEDDVIFESMTNTQALPEQKTGPTMQLPIDRPQTLQRPVEPVQLSSNAPYFFPLLPHERSRGGVKDIMAVSVASGWMKPLLHPISSEDARHLWESQKVALTRDWKQRHREACKRQRKGASVNDLE